MAPRVGQVHVAGSAEEADALLARHRFDLAILDISLPGRTGIDLLRELRAQGNDCEVVLITAFADLDTAIEALRAGAGDFLLKPFRVAQALNDAATEISGLRNDLASMQAQLDSMRDVMAKQDSNIARIAAVNNIPISR